MKNKVIAFCIVIVILLFASIWNSITSQEPEFTVALNGEINPNKGFPEIIIQTDLPDDSVIHVYMHGRNSTQNLPTESVDVPITQGVGKAVLTNSENGFPNGEYLVELKLEPRNQSEALKKKIGEKGEYLEGNNIRNEYLEYVAIKTISIEIADSNAALPKEKTVYTHTEPTPLKEKTKNELIESYIKSHVWRNYRSTVVDSISINDDLGTTADGDYVALVRLTWNVENNRELTEKMLRMYSDDLAAAIADDQPDVQEIAVFWEVPYHGNRTSKFSYERRSNGMYLTDTILGF